MPFVKPGQSVSPLGSHFLPGAGHRLVRWIETVRGDGALALRQLRKHPVTSAAAILSLALAIGAGTAAFRLIDAVLLRPLPVAHPEQLYSLERLQIDAHGQEGTYAVTEYPLFRRMREVVADRAELLAISSAALVDLTYGSDREMERAFRQYVSGRMFTSFDLRPASGRLLTDADDRTPNAHPVVVLSYDYWTMRFGQDHAVVGRTLRIGTTTYDIVGVANAGFTGTDTGTVTALFVPTMMHPGVERDDWSWFRTWLRVKPGVAIDPLRDELQALFTAFQAERLTTMVDLPPLQRDRFARERLLMAPAGAGVSDLQKDHRASLLALGVLGALVLLIACANVANLLSAQTASRAREMALRISIGAGRWRLAQLVLIESAWLALLASALGALFAWWATPFVVSMLNPPDNPVRLALPADWRVLGFGFVVALGVAGVFGLGPAIRASNVSPAHALKGGGDPHASRRTMHVLIGAQVAFCVLVTFVAGLFVTTFERLVFQPKGYSASRLVTMDVEARPGQPPAAWNQVTERLRALPGVERAAVAGWPLLSRRSWNGFVSVNGVRRSDLLTFFLGISPGWPETMGIRFVAGRDLQVTDTGPDEATGAPGAAIVNEKFVESYFPDEPVLGRVFERVEANGRVARYQIVGIVGNTRYRSLRDPMPPAAYVPLTPMGLGRPIDRATFIVRTSAAGPLSLAPVLRQEVTQAAPALRVSATRTQQAIDESHTVRERLLASVALFFAGVALALAGVGLYGVLDYSVLQRSREIGIRMALGARPADVVWRVTAQACLVVVLGGLVGVAAGLLSVRSIETLFYGVRASDPRMLALPCLGVLMVALVAAARPVVRAVRLDPVKTLRAV